MAPDHPFDRDHINVRDWRRKPPLRLRVTQKAKTCWWWIKYTHCPHRGTVAIAPYVIRWGRDGGQDMLRQTARCTECGKRVVALQHPSWGGADTGWAPMQISQMAPVALNANG
jgi:hypothetical protein